MARTHHSLETRFVLDSAVQVYHYDLRGSTIAITDAAGVVTDAYSYAPFGTEAASSGATPNPSTFTGRSGVQTDAPDFLFVRARHHGTGLGRFVQRDRVRGFAGEPQTWNAYPYGRDNATLWIDENGEFVVTATLGVGVADIGSAVATSDFRPLLHPFKQFTSVFKRVLKAFIPEAEASVVRIPEQIEVEEVNDRRKIVY